jgi:type IV pilus assembly protein PilY1
MNIRKFKNGFGRFGAVLGCSVLCLTPVWADDTEIFFADSKTSGALPNVLFIMDTSGSMSNKDGGDKQRIERVQDALHTLIGSLNNVNVGLMRFSNPGGPVLFPTTYIDKAYPTTSGVIDSISELATPTDFDSVAGVALSSGDAIEVLATGEMDLDDERLALGTTLVASAGGGGGGSEFDPSYKIFDSEDDAHEVASGAVFASGECTTGSSAKKRTCTLKFNGEKNAVGMRFRSIQIPAGSTIVSAKLHLKTDDRARLNPGVTPRVRTANAGDRHSLTVDIYAEKSDAGAFSNTNGHISTRFSDYGNLVGPISWDIPKYPNGTELVADINLASLVQDVIDEPGWDGSPSSTTNNISFLFHRTAGSGKRNFQSSDRSNTLPDNGRPTLNVIYTTGAPPTEEPVMTGVHFSDVDVPAGATLTEAYLVFNADEDNSTPAAMSISLDSADNPAPFTANLKDLSSRTLSGALAWTPDNWVAGGEEQIDVMSLVQAKVSSAGWCGGNNMAFAITASSGQRLAVSRDATGTPPQLRIKWKRDSIVPGASCIAKTNSSISIESTENDGISDASGKSLTLAGTELPIDGTNLAVLRFPNVKLLPTSVITSAHLTLSAAGNTSGGASTFSIRGELSGDADTLAGETDLFSRGFSGPVSWSVTDEWVDEQAVQTADIGPILRVIQSNPSWADKNAMLFRIDLTGGAARDIHAFDDNPALQAKLTINYIDDGTEDGVSARTLFLKEVDQLSANGYTPVQDTMYEAYQYYTGGNVVWGKYRGGHDEDGNKIALAGSDGPFTYTRVSAEGSIKPGTYSVVRPSGCPADDPGDSDCNDENGPGQPVGEYLSGTPVYVSPIDNFCQKTNHIILLTDGYANEPHSEDLIKAIDGIDSCSSDDSSSEACVRELTKYMAENDISSLTEDQHVVTHTVGFNFSSDWLEEIATVSGGRYTTAGSAEELVTAIQEILQDVLKDNSTFVAPVAAINQFNRLTHLNQIYFAVFRPDEVPRWPGNLKRYRLGVDGGESNVILDQNGNRAVDGATGFFKEGSRSYWSATDDGPQVDAGGAASRIPGYARGLRKVYTYLESLTGHPKDLTHNDNAITDLNLKLTHGMLGVSSSDRTNQIEWIRGRELGGSDQRYSMGDPLHSKPVAVTYGAADPNAPEQDVVVYMGTNGGGLHAIDAKTGVEKFVYIPEDLLKKQYELRLNRTSQRHIYGIDGSVTPWIKDVGNDGITPGTGDYVHIYFGMRRGGRNYYALDVTNPDAPKVLWTIKGGTGDFAELGQSWGRPIPGRIKLKDKAAQDVLFISGGYDVSKDGQTVRSPDSLGRALYVVDAKTGDKIWSGGPSSTGFTKKFDDMKYSMPATVTLADANADGLDDLIFIGDTGGQVWRFDIEVDKPVANLITGGVIADLGVADGDNTEERNRRFFHSPDVAMIENEAGDRELAITIGSGFRPSPLSKVTKDKFYMLRQTSVFNPPPTYVKLLESDLYDSTDNRIGDGKDADGLTVDQAAERLNLAKADGWYFDLPNEGEKVLSTPLSFRGTVVFTTYQPDSSAISCKPKAGKSRVYQVYLGDAQPVNNWDDVDSDLNEDDRSEGLETGSIIDEPVIICTDGGCDVFAGAEKPGVDLAPSERIVKTFWRKDS